MDSMKLEIDLEERALNKKKEDSTTSLSANGNSNNTDQEKHPVESNFMEFQKP
jgi:hypothetical protein